MSSKCPILGFDLNFFDLNIYTPLFLYDVKLNDFLLLMTCHKSEQSDFVFCVILTKVSIPLAIGLDQRFSTFLLLPYPQITNFDQIVPLIIEKIRMICFCLVFWFLGLFQIEIYGTHLCGYFSPLRVEMCGVALLANKYFVQS